MTVRFDDPYPSYQEIRRKVGQIARERGEWAGYPVPVTEAKLVVAPRHPAYAMLHGKQLGEQPDEPEGPPPELVNHWYDHKRRRNVYLWREPDGKPGCGYTYDGMPGARATAIVMSMGVAMTMDVGAERRAMTTLRQLVPEHLADAYELTGSFIESSKRSGVFYLFRRLATTLALRADAQGHMKILAALCLHPLAYYDGLPIGSMVPTDDVIAHLVMMRADEHLFWRRANQHHPFQPGAQL